MNPTDNTYKLLNATYEFLNKELFEGKLPGCLITMQRRNKTRGYFLAERFETRNADVIRVHEIALNPSTFKDRTDADILSTLLHEMVHLWQEENGTSPRKNYHNREWSEKMENFGLIPSNTGEPEGRKTGQSMSHYINPGGKFDNLMKTFLIEHITTIYQDVPQMKVAAKKNKMKYSCFTCGLNVWAKPNASIMCGDDKVPMEAVE